MITSWNKGAERINDGEVNNLNISVNGTDKPVIIRGDPVRIEQIIWNLVSNALKFTPPGRSISVKVSQGKESARLDVIDTGKGIAPDFMPYVFDIFRQAMPPTTRTKGGLGIGLALVKQLVNLHGGRVEAVSDGLDKGARFTIWLPLYHSSSAESAHALPAAQSSIAGLRILLIDDIEEVVSALKSLLEFEGATVFAATRASDGLKLLAEKQVDLIVSDIAMPEMDGYEFIEAVRKQPQYRELPAIAITGLGRQRDVENALEAGFSAHISKPVSIDAIVAKICELRSKSCERDEKSKARTQPGE
jgi:two-component system CheB/CheR fusion protein